MENACERSFREVFSSGGTPLFGSFIKTPTSHSVEIIGDLGFDFVVVDAEHAPFDRGAIDMVLLAARAARVAAIVRVPVTAPDYVLAALDDGATGILAPHIASARDAADLVSWCRYSGKRGFSNSPRAGRYGGKGVWQHIDEADKTVTVIAMIEDAEAVERIDEIVGVVGLDGVFVGRGDLGVALGDREPGAPRVKAATDKVIEAARRARKPVCLLAANAAEAAEFRVTGVSAFVISSDQGFMRTAAKSALGEFQVACQRHNQWQEPL
ncbi:HpcH/HpaI aldolase family protein [Paraburkholderia sp. SIMBA_030]|uniref:HpcH/HpaI aldolase family protein n=1 Tax=Paraburkholderia sp. SIMBA_030 TaxID=3085773 RepID=UPI00397D1D7D